MFGKLKQAFTWDSDFDSAWRRVENLPSGSESWSWSRRIAEKKAFWREHRRQSYIEGPLWRNVSNVANWRFLSVQIDDGNASFPPDYDLPVLICAATADAPACSVDRAEYG